MCYWKKKSDDKLNIAKTDITVYKVTCSDSITKKVLLVDIKASSINLVKRII